jgi:hypothetical protein
MAFSKFLLSYPAMTYDFCQSQSTVATNPCVHPEVIVVDAIMSLMVSDQPHSISETGIQTHFNSLESLLSLIDEPLVIAEPPHVSDDNDYPRKKMRSAEETPPLDIWTDRNLSTNSPESLDSLDLELSSILDSQHSSALEDSSNLSTPVSLTQSSLSFISPDSSFELSDNPELDLPASPSTSESRSNSLQDMRLALFHARALVAKKKLLNAEKSQKLKSLKVKISGLKKETLLLEKVRSLADQIETLSRIMLIRVTIYRTDCLSLLFSLSGLSYELKFEFSLSMSPPHELIIKSSWVSLPNDNDIHSEQDKLAKVYFTEMMSASEGPLSPNSLLQLKVPKDIRTHLQKVFTI